MSWEAPTSQVTILLARQFEMMTVVRFFTTPFPLVTTSSQSPKPARGMFMQIRREK